MSLNSKQKSMCQLATTELYPRGGEPIYYPGPHELRIMAGGPQIAIGFILKVYLYLTVKKSDFF